MRQFDDPRDPTIDREAAIDVGRSTTKRPLSEGVRMALAAWDDDNRYPVTTLTPQHFDVAPMEGPTHAFGKALGQLCDGLDDPPAAALQVVRAMLRVLQPYDRKIVLACLEGDQGADEV